jgi:4-hydroxy-tetrahydrodipicolinate reductase
VALGEDPLGLAVSGSVSEALDGIDVLIDYTSPIVVKANALSAIDAGVAVVIGTSGLTGSDYGEIDEAARARSVGVVASGNFSMTAAMCQAAALLDARHLPHSEVIDYARATKPDVPSGTARELAERLGEIPSPVLAFRSRTFRGPGRREARGSPAPRSTRSASPVSSCRPRSYSACPTSDCRSVTTPAALPSHTSPERCSRPDEPVSSSG